MTRWGYKTIFLTDGRTDEATLNQAGAEGWELVAVTSANGWTDSEGFFYDRDPVAYLKRPIQEAPPGFKDLVAGGDCQPIASWRRTEAASPTPGIDTVTAGGS